MDAQARAGARAKGGRGFAGERGCAEVPGLKDYLRNASMASGMESNFDSSIVEEGIAAAECMEGIVVGGEKRMR